MNIEVVACVFRSVIFLGLLGAAYKLIYRRAMVDEFRYDLGEMHSRMLQEAREARIPIDSPVLVELNKTLDGIQSCADRISLLRFALVEGTIPQRSLEITPSEHEVFWRVRTNLGQRMFTHLIAVSPLLWPAAAILGMCRRVMGPAQRLHEKLVARTQDVAEGYCGVDFGRFRPVTVEVESEPHQMESLEQLASHSATWAAAASSSELLTPSGTRKCQSDGNATGYPSVGKLSGSGERRGH